MGETWSLIVAPPAGLVAGGDDDDGGGRGVDEDAVRAHIAYGSPDADTETLIELVREACEDLIVGELTLLLSLDTVGHQVDRRRARCPDKIANAGF